MAMSIDQNVKNESAVVRLVVITMTGFSKKHVVKISMQFVTVNLTMYDFLYQQTK